MYIWQGFMRAVVFACLCVSELGCMRASVRGLLSLRAIGPVVSPHCVSDVPLAKEALMLIATHSLSAVNESPHVASINSSTSPQWLFPSL